MTVDEFIHAVRSQVPRAFAQSVASLTEAERKTLSKTAQQLLRDARAAERQPLESAQFSTSFSGLLYNDRVMAEFKQREARSAMALLAVLAVCPKSAAAKVMNLTPEFEAAAVQILMDRRPEWASEWLEAQLAVEFPRVTFASVRRLVREGVCSKPSTRGYATLFAVAAVTADFEADTDLRDDIWLLFQHDVGAFLYFPESKDIDRDEWRQSLRPVKGSNLYPTWPRIIYHYAHRGVIDRSRVLDETLAALWRDFNAATRPGLMKLHELLEPADDERNVRQAAYRELLQNSASPVVGFGLQMLKLLQKDRALDAEAFVEAVPSVLVQKTKAHPLTALSMLKAIVKERSELTLSAATVAIRALNHEAADVQESALSLLETWAARPDAISGEALAEQRDFVSAKLKSRLEALIQMTSSGLVAPPEMASTEFTMSAAAHLSDLHERASLISGELRTACGIDSSLTAIERSEMPAPIDLDQAKCVLADLPTVLPIRDVDELIDCVAQAVETIESPLVIERILDGISRFWDQRPDDFAQRTQALSKRLNNDQQGFTVERGLLLLRFLLPSIVSLIIDWLHDSRDEKKSRPGWLGFLFGETAAVQGVPRQQSVPAQRLVDERIKAIRAQLKKGQFGPVLSLPTHEHGWIDARVFVERIRSCLAEGRQPNHSDVTFGLLRLAPDFRDEAIEQSHALPKPYGRLVRYALGCDEQVTRSDQDWADAWLAAGRTRSPRGRLSELSCLKYAASTNATEPAQFALNWNVDLQQLQLQMYLHKPNAGVVQVLPPLNMNVAADAHPTIALTQQVGQFAVFGSFPGWAEEWLATLWPANPDCFLAMGIDRLILRMDVSGSTWFNMDSALQPLLASERNWSPVALRTLWIGLVSKDADVRAVARDALASGMQDGRAHPEPLAEALLELADKDWFKLNRLVESLRDVARISRWAVLVTVEILNRLIASWPSVPRDAHHVLELQLDLLTDLQVSLPEAARAVLTPQTGGSKTAKLARQLCDLRAADRSFVKQSALVEAAEARIARAERIAAFRVSGPLAPSGTDRFGGPGRGLG